MVQILPIIGAAALLAQTVLGAAVPVKRTQYNNNYNQGNQDTNQYENGSYGNSYNSNSYNSNSYNSGNSYEQNQDSYQNGMGNQDTNQNGRGGKNYEITTTRTAEAARETTTMRDETNTRTAMAHETTERVMRESSMRREDTTRMEHETSTRRAEENYETSTRRAEQTSTYEAYSMPTYGSGSNSWGNNGYNNCVSQCMAQFGSPPSTMTMGNQESLPSATGTGAVHTVLVAPSGAGLRYMPFAVNATVGDTVRYVWTGPNNHTATLSSALAICNKSGIAEQRKFVSGVKNASQGMQVFDVTVETEETQFFYCSVAQHCQKGMFGMINPGNNIGGSNTVGTVMSSMLQSNPGLQAAYNYAMQNISSSSAKNWGMGMSLDGIPEDQYEAVAANVLFTQASFAANPGMLETGLGATNADGSPVMIPDINVLLSNTNAPAPTTLAAAGAATTTPAAAATSSLTPANAYGSNAASKSTVGVWVAGVVGIAGWLLI